MQYIIGRKQRQSLILSMHNLCSKMAYIEAVCKSVFASKLNTEGNFCRYPNLPKMPDCQVIALSLAATLENIHSENSLFAKIANKQIRLMATLPTRQRFNQRAKRLRNWCDELACHLSDEMSLAGEAIIVDSTPLPVCRRARAKRLKICKEDPALPPATGYSAIDQSYYHGYKLHLACSESGVVNNFFLSPANESDIKNLYPLSSCIQGACDLLADKGYISQAIQLELFETKKIRLITPTRRNQRTPSAWTKKLGRKRRRIETLFSQMLDQFALRLNYAKTSLALASRISYKICALTLAQFDNFLNLRPLCQIKNAPLFQ